MGNLTRDEKWGIVWARLQKVCLRARGDDRLMSANERNFALEPARVSRYIYDSLQPECLAKHVSLERVQAAIADLDMSTYTNDSLGPLYIRAAAAERANAM